jgi:hypothetical protein
MAELWETDDSESEEQTPKREVALKGLTEWIAEIEKRQEAAKEW